MIRPAFDTYNEAWADRVVGARSSRGIDGFLGIVVTEMAPGRLVAEMEVTENVITVMGTMHGGCLSAMYDHVLGVVMYPVMPPATGLPRRSSRSTSWHLSRRACAGRRARSSP